MGLTLTDSNGKGFAVVNTGSTASIVHGTEVAVAKYTSEGSKDEISLTLAAGTYKLYGNTSGGSCKIASLKFE